MVPFVQRAQKRWALLLITCTAEQMQICSTQPWSSVTFPLQTPRAWIWLDFATTWHFRQNCRYFVFSFPPVNFCQFTAIDHNNCKAAGQEISAQQDLPIPSLQRWAKTGLLSLSLYRPCFLPLQRACSTEHLPETCKPWKLTVCLILIASRGWIQFCSWRAAGIISF